MESLDDLKELLRDRERNIERTRNYLKELAADMERARQDYVAESDKINELRRRIYLDAKRIVREETK